MFIRTRYFLLGAGVSLIVISMSLAFSSDEEFDELVDDLRDIRSS